MFHRAILSVAPQCGALAGAPVRNMATLKQISMRLKAVTNIQKITKSMKMVSAAKYARAERELKHAKSYGEGAQAFYAKAEVNQDEKASTRLMVALTSDRGLCGAVHSNIGRAIRDIVHDFPPNIDFKIICIGDKGRAQIGRMFKDNVIMHFTDIGKTSPTFADAAEVAKHIINCGYEYEFGVLFFNKFRTVLSQTVTQMPLYNAQAVIDAEKISLYDSVDESVLQDYNEFSLAALVYYAMKENSCSEQGARMTAMDSATKNAGEMIDSLTLTFNRTRQAVITRELIEIISGAAALK